MAVDFGILFVEILFVSICFIGIIIATKKVAKKSQLTPLEETSEKNLKEDLERYILNTKNLLIKKVVLDTLTMCFVKIDDLINFLGNDTKSLATRFLLNLANRGFILKLLDALKSDNLKINLIKEYQNLITEFERIYPLTKELEEIHEKRIELLKLNSQYNEALLDGSTANASNWLKGHPDFFKEWRENHIEFNRVYTSKGINLPNFDGTEEKNFVAIFIWALLFGKDQICPAGLLSY